MPRDLFPFDDGRELIRDWLFKGAANETDWVACTSKVLRLQQRDADPATATTTTVGVCWIAQSDGALYARIPRGAEKFSAVRAINEVLELLGVEERLVREVSEGSGVGKIFHGDTLVVEEEPILLAGPLTVIAFRAPAPGPTLVVGEPPDEQEYVNFYRCDACDREWDDVWTCACDDECPSCGTDYSPYHSEEN